MAESQADKKYKSDVVFNLINKHFITLKDDDMKAYAVHLKAVLNTFVSRMKETDPFFNACFRKIAYVGSYYEGLKVGMPEEFDLNVIINLPIKYDKDLTIIIAPEKPGYIKIKADGELLSRLRNHVRWADYKRHRACQLDVEIRDNARKVQIKFNQRSNQDLPKISQAVTQNNERCRKTTMNKWFDPKNMYFDQNKFRQWFESVVLKTLGAFPYENKSYMLKVDGQQYKLRHKKSGPALTLKIDLPDDNTIDVDLVPALEFDLAPPKPFRSHTMEKKWFAISKPLSNVNNDNILWRPSFYVREQEILKGSVKPVIRQMKKLRDRQNFKSIASYYIKILFLWELEREKYAVEFQRQNPTQLFIHMLRKLQQACENHEILDFWNPTNNLLSTIKPEEMLNINRRLFNIIKEIDKNITTDPYSIAKHILTENELQQLNIYNISNGMASIFLGSQTAPAQARAQNNTFW